MLAEKKKDFPTAEAEFKKAIAASGASEAWIDLAAFYQRRNQPDQAVAAIQSGLASSPRGPVLVDAASILYRPPPLIQSSPTISSANTSPRPLAPTKPPPSRSTLNSATCSPNAATQRTPASNTTAALALASTWPPAVRKAQQLS